MFSPPITGNNDLDAFLYDIQTAIASNASASGYNVDAGTGIISDPSGTVRGYLYQYIAIKYADNNTGGGMSDSPTGKTYFGIKNQDTTVESTNAAEYTWYAAAGGFTTLQFLYYLNTGGRTIQFNVGTSPPSYKWLLDNGSVINLDNITPARTISSNEILQSTITAVELNNGAVTAAKTALSAIDPLSGALSINSVNTNNLVAGAITAVKIGAGEVTADKIAVGSLSAITANLGTVTAGSILGGNININNKFVVGPDGTTAISSGSSGARVIITNDSIKVYDGVLPTPRVIIGSLV